jgi:hypothetical protein
MALRLFDIQQTDLGIGALFLSFEGKAEDGDADDGIQKTLLLPIR